MKNDKAIILSDDVTCWEFLHATESYPKQQNNEKYSGAESASDLKGRL